MSMSILSGLWESIDKFTLVSTRIPRRGKDISDYIKKIKGKTASQKMLYLNHLCKTETFVFQASLEHR